MHLTKHGLDKALTMIAHMFAEQAGIIIKRGKAACTNGKTIWLPECKELALTPEEITVNLGYLFHETGHVLNTDFVSYSSECTGSALKEAIKNTLEDIRIEHLMTQEYRITRHYLDALVKILLERGGFFDVFPESAKPSNVLQAYMLLKLRLEVLGQHVLVELFEAQQKVAEKKFPRTMLIRLDAMMGRVLRCKNTADVAKLALEILKMIEEEKEEQEQEQNQQNHQGKQQQQGQPPGGEQISAQDESEGTERETGQGQGSSGESEGKEGESGQSQGASGESEGSQGESGQSQETSSGAGGQGAQQNAGSKGGKGAGSAGKKAKNLQSLLSMSEKDIKKGIGEFLAKQSEEIAKQSMKSGAHDSSGDLRFPEIYPHGLRGNGKAPLAEIRASSNKMRTQILQWKSVAQDVDEYRTRSGMKLDHRHLCSARTGGKIFLKQEEGIDLEAAISVVVDRSGSMDRRIVTTANAAVATALAFEHPSIAHQVIAFPYGGSDGRSVSIIKKWSDSTRKFASLVPDLTASGGTPMAEAILFSAACLAGREEKRKVMLVITDGEPHDNRATAEALKLAKKQGVHVLALGIDCSASRMANLFGERNSKNIRDIGELAPAMTSMLKDVFMGVRNA